MQAVPYTQKKDKEAKNRIAEAKQQRDSRVRPWRSDPNFENDALEHYINKKRQERAQAAAAKQGGHKAMKGKKGKGGSYDQSEADFERQLKIALEMSKQDAQLVDWEQEYQ